MGHILLLGDSIFDNAAYVAGGLDVIAQLRERLPAGWRATLRAVDGSILRDVKNQLHPASEEDAILIVSAGGNDALGHVEILYEGARSFADVLARLAEIGDRFEHNYSTMLRAVLDQGRPTALCTIYYPRFPEPAMQKLAVTALTVFNDVILRAAFMAGLPLLDLRLICNEEGDYANPIEPSSRGGAKIADAIVRLVSEHDFRHRRTEVFIR